MMKTRHVISFRLLIAFTTAVLFMAAPAQAGGYIHFGLGHHSSHYGYGHSYGYGYSYPYYGLHSYYGYGHHGYDHHSYGYPGYGYSNYGHHYYGYNTPYDSDDDYSSDSTYQNRTYDRGGSHTATGWTLLGNNQASAALTDFGRQAQASPSKGAPKVGYALASADLGQLDKGVWAMRRALRTDPHALHYVTLDQPLDAKVGQIIRQYEKKLDYSSRDGDAAFMLASLHYLRRNIEAARTNINQAMLARHVSTSTINLKNLIDQEKRG